MRHEGFGAALAALMLVPVGQAQAQDGALSEIVVTAQKREQRLQDVPITVTALAAPTLRDAGVRDIKDLTAVVSGFQVTSTSSESATAARIRGIGSIGDNVGLESSVGLVIDGVYRPRNSIGIGDLGELERIEVLKGPQGALFGKNTSAGVINVLTLGPTFERSLDVEATLGSYDERGGSLALNGPLVQDVLAGACSSPREAATAGSRCAPATARAASTRTTTATTRRFGANCCSNRTLRSACA